jgi:isoleucyl-tRNA synthetase
MPIIPFGLRYKHFLNNEIFDFYAADWISNAHTGLVHLAPLYSANDYEIGVQNGLKMIDLHSKSGYSYNDFSTVDINQASQYIIDIAYDKILDYSWEEAEVEIFARSGKPVIEYLSDQVFAMISQEEISNRIQQMIRETKWPNE